MTVCKLITKRVCAGLIGAALMLAPIVGHAQSAPFVVADIRVEGLQRIAPGSVFAALPVGVGDVVDVPQVRSIARNLFRTGNFDDIQVGRDGDVLVLTVA